MKLKGLYILFLSLVCFKIAGQTNPTAQTLPFSQNFSGLLASSSTYPAGFQGWQLSTTGASSSFRTNAASADLNLTASSTAATTVAGVHNLNGKIGILQTGGSDPSICLAINTTSYNGIVVSYDAMTIRNPYNGVLNTRINELTLQYRIGNTGTFSTISIPYQNNTSAQTSGTSPQNTQTKSITLPAACQNQSLVQLRWVARDVSGAGSRPSFALDNISITSCNTNTSNYFYTSVSSGNWNNNSTWQASPDGISGWISVCSPPTNSAALITIQNGHTVTLDAPSSAPDLLINSGGTLIANNSNFTTLTITGNLQNDGILQMANGLFGVDIIFNKNGNQTITGSGGTSNFYSIGLNMGTSISNILEINSTNFSCSSNLLTNSSGTIGLVNGTIKFSGTFTFTNQLFTSGPIISINSGIWLNNPNITITAANYSYNVNGFLRVSAGIYNIGSASGNSIYLLNNSKLIIEGGTLSVASRIDATTSSATPQLNVAYKQSGGTVIVGKIQNTHIALADFELPSSTDSLIMSGGTIIFRNIASQFSDLLHNGYSVITGGTMQFGDALTTNVGTGFEIEAGGPYSYLPSLVLNNSAGLNTIVYPGTDITVVGNITINNGTTLNDYWGNNLGIDYYYNISLSGNWNNSGTFIHNNLMTVSFNGNTAQFITGSTITGFNNLTINNSSGGVTLSNPTLVNGTSGILTLTNGYLYTSSLNTFTMNMGTSTTGASNSSFVYGPMIKNGSTDFIFPVGKDAAFRSIAVSSLTGSETFTAEYFHADPDGVPYDVSLKDPSLDDIGRCEYWILNRAGSVDANVTLSWDTYSCGVTSLPDLAVARWDGSLWKDHGNGGTTGTSTLGTVISIAAISSFSPFTLASSLSGVNPLPIDLLNFTATYNSKNQVDLKWSTASETNNDYFTIERSIDAISFNQHSVTEGGGNSTSILNYYSTDLSPLSGISYYRLKQTDFDGNYRYSNIVAVQKEETVFEIIYTHSDFLLNQFTINFKCDKNSIISIELFDITGKKVFESKEELVGNNSEINFPTTNLITGLYFVKAYNGKTVITKKIKI